MATATLLQPYGRILTGISDQCTGLTTCSYGTLSIVLSEPEKVGVKRRMWNPPKTWGQLTPGRPGSTDPAWSLSAVVFSPLTTPTGAG